MRSSVAAWGLVSGLVGCGDPVEPPSCDGLGEPFALVGERVDGVLAPFDDGDPIAVIQDAGGARFRLDYAVQGVDATAPVTVVLRLGRPGEGTVDYLASATLPCEEPGPARYGAQVDWPASWPQPSTLHGQRIHVDTVFADGGGRSVEVGIDLVVHAPG